MYVCTCEVEAGSSFDLATRLATLSGDAEKAALAACRCEQYATDPSNATTQRYVHLAKKAAVLKAAAVWAPVAHAGPTEPRASKKKPKAKK